MDQSQFWQIIERAKRESAGDLERQVALVEEQLELLSLEEIEAFEHIYLAYHDRSYNKWLWQAIQGLIGFVSDDNFYYHRAWLISRGEGIFSEVLQHPGRVSEFVDPEGEWTLENLNYVAFNVYERRTGEIVWRVLNGRETYPLEGYDWLQPVPPDEGFFDE
jgi:hypothetical protein